MSLTDQVADLAIRQTIYVKLTAEAEGFEVEVELGRIL